MKEVNEAIPSTRVLPGLRNCVEMLTPNAELRCAAKRRQPLATSYTAILGGIYELCGIG